MTSILLIGACLLMPAPSWVPAAYSSPVAGDAPSTPWWKDSRLGELNLLISEALAGNGELSAARARVTQAGAQRVVARSPLLPTLSATSNLNLAPLDSLGFQFGGSMGGAPVPGQEEPPDVYYNGSAGLQASYNVDFAGRAYLSYRAALHNESATKRDRDRAALTLARQITAAYLDAVAGKEQLRVLKILLQANQDFLDVMTLRFHKGEVSGVDLLQQKGQLATTAAQLPQAEALVTNSRRILALLLGRFDTSALPQTLDTLPQMRSPKGTGTPADLINHRPGLLGAAMRSKAAQKQAQSALGRHLPTLKLSGQYGNQYFHRTEWATQKFWGAGVSLSVPLFSGFSDDATLTQAKANANAAHHSFEQLYQQAISDVEISQIKLKAANKQLQAVLTALDATEQAYSQSKERYLSGVGGYTSALTALRSYQQSQLTTIQTKRNQLSAEIQLRTALGGPWTHGLGENRRGNQ